MKKHVGLICLLVLMLTGCAVSKQSTKVPAFHARKDEKMTAIRHAGIEETAISIGAQGGLASRAHQVNRMLNKHQHELDRTFNFNGLILNDNVLPPVLTQGDDSLKLNSHTVVRLADKEYRIVRPPMFVTTPPSWREYLWMNFNEPEAPDKSLLPKGYEERVVWNAGVEKGWKQGVEQANEIYDANLARLKRDFSGMVLYRKLLAQNIVSAPFVARTNLGVTGGGDHLRLNDKILRITSTSQLNADTSTWKAAVYNHSGENGDANGKRVGRILGNTGK